MTLYNTGDMETKPVRLWGFLLEEQTWLIEAVMSALSSLTFPSNWNEAGDVSPDIAAERATDAVILFDRIVFVIGMIIPYAGTTTPTFALPCDGSTYDADDYPQLWAVIDPAFKISGTQFVTPDLRGRTVVGTGSSDPLLPSTMGETGGAADHTLITDELPAHDHTTQPHSHTNTPHSHTDAGHVHSEISAVATIINGGIEAPAAAATPFPSSTGIGFANIQAAGVVIDATTVNVDLTGGGQPHNNIQPSIALKYVMIAL